MRAAVINAWFRFPFAIAASICFSCCDAKSNMLCVESEREALLMLKNDLSDPSNRLSSWVQTGDCCKWNGVFCNNLTGHVTQLHLAAPLSAPDYDAPHAEWEAYKWSMLGGTINPSLLHLKHLSSLDLSNNNFSSIPIPDFFGLLGSLTCLNLSHSLFQGAIPHNLGNLSKLQYLDLGGNFWLQEAKSLEWVSGLSSLQYLDFSGMDLHVATDWLQVTFNLPSLLELHLSDCSLAVGPSPISTVNSTKSLSVLDLSLNHLSSVPMPIFGLHGLVSLNLSGNYLHVPIPDYFGNISFLEVLDLGFTYRNSSLPNSLYSLNHLQFLCIAGNNFQGEIPSAIGNLSSLIHLDLSHGNLQGKLPASLGDLCKLKEIVFSSNEIEQDISEILECLSKCCSDCLESLNMDNNNIFGTIPLFIRELSSLKFFDVSGNQLNGTFPPSLGQLENLETLNIGQNLFKGVVLETYFSNLTRLTTLKASGNMLRFQPNSSWVPPFQCETIELSEWYLGPKFPQWLMTQKNLSGVDISHAGISDVVPAWFWNLSSQFESVNLSSNDLTGEISYLNVRTGADLSSNRFTGPLPKVLPGLSYLILSNNSFSGSLSELVCNSSEQRPMMVLDIATNLLFGEIPDCWNQWHQLLILNLGNNNLTGKFPPSLGYTSCLVLNLGNNSMFGELPSALQNGLKLLILDLSDNHFSGSVPAWIGDKLSRLRVLRLRSNNFDGHIPHKICALQSLQNLDLSHNNISGDIPTCFSNMTAMTTKFPRIFRWGIPFHDKFFYLSSLLVLKGREDEYSTTLGLVTSMDLSANSFTGEIPKELGALVGLRSINLSWNLLTGKIPDNIGNIDLMESLDLSMNQLHGRIPSNFSNLNFLNHFNVSYNNLTGQIPTSTQLQSFENSSYMANHLCGPPLIKSCSTNDVPTNDEGNTGKGRNGLSEVKGLYVSMVVGFVMGFGVVVFPLLFIQSWRRAYYQKLSLFWAKVVKLRY